MVSTGGSIGKETMSVDSADLDLNVILDGELPGELPTKIQPILDKLQMALDEQYPGTRDEQWFRRFGLRYNISGMEIDILVAARDVSTKDFLAVSDPKVRAYMRASVSTFSRSFIKKQGILCKDLVRVIKDRRDSFRWGSDCKPKSYLLEILVLEACRRERSLWWKQRGRTGRNWRIRRSSSILLEFFDLIASVDLTRPSMTYDKYNLPQVFVCFDDYYTKDNIPMDELMPIFELRRMVRKGHG